MPLLYRLLALSFFLISAACSPSNLVSLDYASASPVGNVIKNQPHVTLLLFDDQRSQNNIGKRNSGEPFIPAHTVPEWISKALRDELARLGLSPRFELTESAAIAQKPDFLIKGIVHTVWIEELNATSYKATIGLAVQVLQEGKVIFSEKLTTSQDFFGLPSRETANILLANTLQDLLLPLSQKLVDMLT